MTPEDGPTKQSQEITEAKYKYEKPANDELKFLNFELITVSQEKVEEAQEKDKAAKEESKDKEQKKN